jgi:dipeptidyl aminopeptidase/acylaminoacyl peptidase
LDRHKKSLVGVRFTGIKRATIWLDEDLRKLQTKFDREMPHKTIAIHDWDETRSRFIMTVSSSADPGTWFVVDRKSGKMIEFAKRAPWLTPDVRHPGGPFEFTTPQGVRINGYLTLPREKRAGRMPLVVYCRETAWGRQMPEFSSHVQAVAAMGFAVLQVNHRGCEGFGTKHRVSAGDAIDRAAAEDILAAVDWVCTREKIHPKLTAVFGFGWGGYFALRTMELYPKRFRCGVVVDPQTDVGMMFNYENEFSMRTEVYKQLFGKDRKKLQEMSASHNAGTLTQPLLVIRNEDAGGGTRAQTEAILSAVRATGNTPEIVNVTREFMRKPVATAKTFDQIQGFFNLNIYKFDAEAGEAKVVEDPKPQAPEDKIVPDGVEP